MNRRPGQVDVVTEVGYCPSCGRTRNLRRESHHLGALVRTIVTCETCHRTLSSSIGVAAEQPISVPPESAPEPQPAQVSAEPAAAALKKPVLAKRAVATTKPAAAKKPVAAAKAVATKKPAVAKRPVTAKKPATRGGKPTSTVARKATKKK